MGYNITEEVLKMGHDLGNMKDTFVENLNRIAAEQGLNQVEIAKKLGVAQPSVHYWFSGQKMPRNDKIDALAKILGCSRFDLTLPKDFRRKPLADKEWDIIEAYRASDAVTKEMVRRILGVKEG